MINAGGLDQDWGEKPFIPDESWWASVLADDSIINDDEEKSSDEILPKESNGSISLNWKFITETKNIDSVLNLTVVGYNKGGLLARGIGIEGFVPVSHLINVPANISENERDEYLKKYIGKNISVKIIECNQEKARIVLSERAALAGEGQRNYLLRMLEQNSIIEGTVTNITDFGVFVDLGGLEGLIHVSELSWGRVDHPSEIVKLGEKIQVVVIQIDHADCKIALSLKRTRENPWLNIKEHISIGDVVPAVITCVKNYGAFARLDNGIEGLVHISSIKIHNGITIRKLLRKGQQVRVEVLRIEAEQRRLSLSLCDGMN